MKVEGDRKASALSKRTENDGEVSTVGQILLITDQVKVTEPFQIFNHFK